MWCAWWTCGARRGRDNKTWDEWAIRSGKIKKEEPGRLWETAPASRFTLLTARMHSEGHVWLSLSPSSSTLSLSVSFLWWFSGWMPVRHVKPPSQAVKMEWMYYYKEGENVCGGILPDNSAGTLEHRGKKTLISRNPNKMDRFRKEMTNSYCIFISSSSGDLCVLVKSIKKSLGPAYFVIM